MVCARCIKVVKEELEKLGLTVLKIDLGEVQLKNHLNKEEIISVKKRLEENGFELLEDKKKKIIEQIKTIIIDKIHR